MKGKLIAIGLTLFLMFSTLVVFKIKNPNSGASNPLVKYSSLSQLRKHTIFKFNVPLIINEEKNLQYKSLNGQMVEISNDTLTLKAAPFLAEKADVGGNYGQYKVDEKYDVIGDYTYIVYLRYRTNDDKTIVLNYNTKDIAYSLKINKQLNVEDAISLLGLKRSSIKLKEENDNENNIVDAGNYDTYILKSLGYQISIPKSTAKVTTLEGESPYKYSAFLIADRPVLSIEESKETEQNNENIHTKILKDGYVLKYYKNNPFNEGTPNYNCYNSIIESMEYITKSFNKTENTK